MRLNAISLLVILHLLQFVKANGSGNSAADINLDDSIEVLKKYFHVDKHHLGDDSSVNSRVSADSDLGQQEVKRYKIANFDFDHVSTPYIISLWIIIVGLAKIGFHVTPKLASLCPESVVLMILGVIIGLIMFFAGISEDKLQPLTPDLFFLFMLPPIVMDAGYHMPNRLFFDNLTSILLYAVVGTVWNAVAIGISLYGCARLGWFGEEMPFLDIMLFSSTISAVDPVAVLAVFEEIHVNEVLYILVFGESLLNDAVTVVLYHMFEGYAEMAKKGGIESILPVDYIAGITSFFVISLGGTFMGVVWGFLAAFVSRFTHHVKIIEPIFVFVMAYLSYLSAEMFHLSGILSLTFCGITMKNYVEENVTQKSHTTLKYAMKMLANSSEAIIFVFLGVCTVNDYHQWNTAFVLSTIIFCLVYRTIGVILLTAMINKFRLHRLNKVEQFIMSYGGLRGAVAFALILIVNKEIIPSRQMMVTTVIAVVYFTVFLQGMTIGALVKILNVPRANKFQMSMNERIHTRMIDHLMSGMEDIAGMMVGNYKLRDKFRNYNNKYLRIWLLRDHQDKGNYPRKIFETCSKLDLQDAMNMVTKPNFNFKNNNDSNHLSVLTANKSLSALFRTYTQSNLNIINNEEGEIQSSAIPSDPYGSFNFDIGNLAYSPSRRDLADAEIHHILDDAMFKPVKKVRRYSRADLSEGPSLHPPFQHQVRMQIRHIISQQHKHRRKHPKRMRRTNSDDSTSNGSSQTSPNNGFIPNNNVKFGVKDFYLKVDEQHLTRPPDRSKVEREDDGEAGITFTAKLPSGGRLSPLLSEESANDNDSPDQGYQLINESTLPWRRKEEDFEGALSPSAVRQEEFPCRVVNKEHLQSYASPTNTFLDKLDGGKSSAASARKPAVFEIFRISDSDDGNDQSQGSDGNKTGTTATKGRFRVVSTSTSESQSPKESDEPTVAINMAFEGEEAHDSGRSAVYKL